MGKNHVAFALLAGAGAVISLNPAPAIAQSAAPAAGIEEVVVTAQRREEVLSKVPMSVTAFTAERIDQLNAKNFGDLVAYTPGVNFDADTNSISIRGVNSAAGDATTGIYIDDTPIQLRTLGFGSDNALPDVFDLERVEVLRGPQGTLFGAGSEGGTVRFITPKPSLTDLQIYGKTELSFTQGGAPSYEGGVAVGAPIVDDKLGFRVSGWWRHDGGWIDHVDPYSGNMIEENANHTNTLVLHGALLWQATNDLSITPSVFYQDRNVHNDDEYWVALSSPGDGRYINETPELMGNKDHFTLPALKLDWNAGGAELISNTSYFDRKQIVQDYSATLYDLSYFQQSVDYGVLPIDYETPCTAGICGIYAEKIAKDKHFVGDPLLGPGSINLPGFGPYKATNIITNTQQNFTQEVRLQSTDSDAPLVWVLGAFYTQQSQLSVEEINDPQLGALTNYLWGDPSAGGCYGDPTGDPLLDVWCEDLLPNGDDYINHTVGHERQEALFGNATIAIIPQLKLQVGARVAKTHFDYNNFADGPQDFGPNTPNTGKQDETPFTPMANITWQVTDTDMLYATVSKGYRIGGANAQFPLGACTELSQAPGSYNSDTVVNYEAGTKDRFFDNRLQMSGSVFYLEWNNIQQLNYLPSCGFQYTANVGSARSTGFDLEGEWLPIDALDIDFSLGYTDAQFTSTSITGGQLLATKGDKLPGSPWTFSLGAQYNTPVFGRDAFIRMDYQYQSKTPSNVVTNDPLASSYDPALIPNPATNIVRLRAGATFGDVSLALFADNLFNSHPQLNLTHQDSSTLLFEATALRPRTIGITATYRQ
ncbi:MAG TPA: TonB-dependent receptor [Rhizomicrobium sp.]|jgi:outer membrane receptor protein involved in Fe transport|nr:TonB-dependent receptor [Rhizomicrobium sp.]